MNSVSSEEFGKDIGLVHEAIVTGRKVGAGRDFWTKLAHDQDFFQKIADLVNPKPTYKMVVDYNRTLVQMVKAGNYDSVDRDITEKNFLVGGEGKLETKVVLFHFNKTMTSKQVAAEMDGQGYRSDRIERLLALGESQPDLQRQFPIVALGSVWSDPNGHRRVPVLYGLAGERGLRLYWFDDAWRPYYRFLGLRK